MTKKVSVSDLLVGKGLRRVQECEWERVRVLHTEGIVLGWVQERECERTFGEKDRGACKSVSVSECVSCIQRGGCRVASVPGHTGYWLSG